jgi:tripartite-type tricarboxylate transporter receptor subunit TctC
MAVATWRKARVCLGVLTCGIAAVGFGSLVRGDVPVFKNKTVIIYVGAGAGGGYDENARFVAAHLSGFIPGAPKVVVENQPGGGGIASANSLYFAAPKDGTAIGTFSNAMVTAPLFGTGQARFQPDQFGWIGSTTQEPGVCVVARNAGVSTLEEFRNSKIVVGATGPGTTTFMYAALLQNIFGAKFKVVSGYRDSPEIALALERGEIQGICETYSSVLVDHPDWLRDRFVVPVVAFSRDRIKDLPSVPTLSEFARSEKERQILQVAVAPTAAGRPFAAPPGIPAADLAVLRTSFGNMAADPAFQNDAVRSRITLQYVEGAQIQQIVRDLYELPSSVIADTKRMVGRSIEFGRTGRGSA